MTQQTLSIIKPDATKRNLIGRIVSKLESSGLKVIAQKKIQLTELQAKQFYKVHEERPFYNDLVDFMISGPVIVQVLEGDNAVKLNRTVNQIAENLTNLGLEVESFKSLNDNFENFFICKILKSYKHPNADRLKICEISLA